MFDAHSHLQDSRLSAVFDKVVWQAEQTGLTGVCTCGTAPSDWDATARLARFPLPFTVVPAFGVHPWHVRVLPHDWLDQLESYLGDFSGAAVGEVGLDGLRNGLPFDVQESVFVNQLRLAVRLGRPVVVHGACAWERLAAVVRPFVDALPGFVVHGFGGSAEQLNKVLGMGGYVSIAGTVCNPKAAKVRAVAHLVPEDRLLVETDSPDLFPQPGTPADLDNQGKPLNQPANLVHILHEIAVLRHMRQRELATVTQSNAQRIYLHASD